MCGEGERRVRGPFTTFDSSRVGCSGSAPRSRRHPCKGSSRIPPRQATPVNMCLPPVRVSMMIMQTLFLNVLRWGEEVVASSAWRTTGPARTRRQPRGARGEGRRGESSE